MEVVSVSSPKKRKPWPRDQFTDLLLSMSLQEIFDDNLYKHQVEKIPQLFESVDQYFQSYVFPVLEETRAGLLSAMETIYRAPFAEVSSLVELKHDELLYGVNTDQWRNRVSDRGKEPYRTLPGDIVMISNVKPETALDLQRFGFEYTFAAVRTISEDLDGDNFTTHNFRIKAAKHIDVGDGVRKSWYVVFLTNITTNKRIWNALHMRGNLKIVENILSKPVMELEDCEICTREGNTHMGDGSVSSLLSSLNESQNQAILASLHRLECHHTSSVQLIWGPPGTGKTRTLSFLLYILLKMNVRTLICAPTNVAITELASRVVKLVKDSPSADCEKGLLPCPLGDILIFGNKDNLKLGSDIEEIFLDHRVNGLGNCLGRFTGWRHCTLSMINFLEHCGTQFHTFLDNEINTEESSQDETLKTNSKSFLEYARERVEHTIFPFRRSVETFLTHVPRRSILDSIFQSMQKILPLLNTFERILFDENMKSEELEKAFSSEEIVSGSESFGDSTVLLHIRSEILSILKSLQSAPLSNFPDLTNKATCMEFCFQKASLIFCTTSSSFKLHSVDMEPLDLLVIDEAAQVKECESIIALQIPDVRHAILVGDEWQLPATVSSKVCEEAGFGRSLFERLSALGHSKHLLDMQYRMHPDISQFPNSNFYRNQILDAPTVEHPSYQKCYLQGKMFGPYSFINIADGVEELDDVGRSRRNMVEVAVVVKLIHKLYKGWNGSKEKLSIGVISPYAAQVVAIQDKLKHMFENLERFVIKVKSIDGFQGGEEDVIIISTVRSNKGGVVGFLSSPQRTNVALTRARHCLWILGNAKTLSRSDSVWEALIQDAKYRRCFFTADEDCDIAKTVVDVKKELDQLEDLLNADSVLFKSARWKVLFSDNFRRSFCVLKPSHLKKLVVNLLLKLASGWRPRKINVELPCESSSHIVNHFKVEGYYIICSVDVIKEDSVYNQILKVWDVLPVGGIPKLLRRLDMIFAMYTDEFSCLCKETTFEGNLEVPKSWSMSQDIIRFKTPETNSDASSSAIDCRGYVENSRVSESLLLMKFYSLSSSTVKHLLSDHEGKELDLPFEVTDQERETIVFPRTSFILGRSGTGKTTVLTMKLYRTLQQYCFATGETVASDKSVHASDDIGEYNKEANLRQLFVTVSPKLCYAVKQHVTQLKRFATGSISADVHLSEMDNIDDIAEFKDIPDSFVGIQRERYPLIITFHKFIMMLDGTVGNSYFERFCEVSSSNYEARNSRSVALQTFMRRNEVTFDRFMSSYWPHFNSKMTKHLDPSRVFTEIMSHIKGGLQDGEACDGKRSREEYISLCNSRVSTLSAKKREDIYEIFLDYEKMKMENSEFDMSDLVNDIHFRLNSERLLGDKMDFVYIDEVQDLTMRQIALFRYICKNVDEGFVFSGDTAQTIARGIDFRFEDIRSLFYSEFLMKSRNCQFRGRRGEKGLISDTFHLSHNFRTHIGVLRLAQSVIDLIGHFYPQCIDALAPENSLIYGEPPVLLEPGSDENAIVTIFGNSNNTCRKWIGFGAQQVILVRDDAARNEISNYIGNQAIVLTIVECKGLEFQDVLLYNFFGSSPISNQWRVLYEFMKERCLLDDTSPVSFPTFNEARHNILCSELKQLYVAITRTRQRLWICEKNEDVSKPMFDYWRNSCLVQERKVDDSIAEAMQRASSPEEWRAQGIKLFWERNYEMATMCFEKAGEEIWEKRAKASGLRATADRLRDSNSAEARVMLIGAAEIFESIGKADIAAECFCDLGEYERAGRIYLEKCGISELTKAGECFMLAGSYKTAAEVYGKGNLFVECLSACTKGKNFKMGLQYIENWKQQAAWDSRLKEKLNEIDTIAQDYLESCARECYKSKDNAAMLRYVRALHTIESKRNFLKSLDCLRELLTLEEESGNFNEAAEIAKLIGDVLLEVDMLAKGENYVEASSLILSYTVSHSLWISRNQGWPLKSFPQKEQLLSKAKSLASNVSESFSTLICKEAESLSHEQRSLSDLMQGYITSKQCKSHISEILSVKKLLDAQLQVRPANYVWENELPSNPEKYSEGQLLRNEVSVGTLVYAWTLHKENVLVFFESLDSLESQGYSKCKVSVEPSLKYFGVRFTNDASATCQLLNPNAAWVKNVEVKFLRRNKNMVSLDARHFVLAARKYWQKEMLLFGFRVLETLQDLHLGTVNRRSPKYYQCTCLSAIHNISRFFMESKVLDIKQSDSRRLEDFIQQCMGYFELIFPLDPLESVTENMITLRESENSKKLLEDIMSRNLNTRSELTYSQIGQAITIWLGSGKPRHEVYEKMIENIGEHLSWKSFMARLWSMESPRGSDVSDSVEESLVADSPLYCDASQEFFIALEYTYKYANWMTRDYISPNIFLYLVERLLIMVPHPRGFFFTPKSAYVEWLICHTSGSNSSAALIFGKPFSSKSIFSFVSAVIQELTHNIPDTLLWVEKSRIDARYYFPLLMLRLVMIQCLLCLNYEMPFDIIYNLLGRIGSHLPCSFCDAMRYQKKRSMSYLDAIAKAFSSIGDPVVIVAASENKFKLTCPEAIFLDLKLFSSKKDIMDLLFPRTARVASVETNVTEIVSGMISKQDPSLGTENGTAKPCENWELFQRISETMLQVISIISAQRDDHGNSKSLDRKKGDLDKQKNLLMEVHEDFCQISQSDAGVEEVLCTAIGMAEYMESLATFFDKSDPVNFHLLEIKALVEKLQCNVGSKVIDRMLGEAMGSKMDGNEVSDVDHGSGKASGSSVATSKPCNQENERSKGKGKKNTNKRGKGKGRGKK